jgi:Caspase domain
MRLVFALALMLAVAAVVKPVSAQQGSGSCTALLVGNSNYKSSGEPALREPVNDARSMGEELKRTGFDVEVKENLTKEAMQRAIDGFYGRIGPGMTGLLFFSGYGIQANRETFLIPVDADIFNESEVRPNGISLDAVLAEMNRRGAGVKIAIIDAARRFNPFENRFRRTGAGLAPPGSPRGTLVMYSATAGTPGELVRPSGKERGLFVGELLKEIQAPGVSVEEVFNRTRMGVSRASSGDQNPWMSSSLSREFSFSNCRRDVILGRDQPQLACKVANAPPPKPTGTPPTKELRELNERVRVKRDAAAFNRRGGFYAQYGEFAHAINDLDEAIRLKPDDPDALNNRCWVRTILGDTFQALEQALDDCNKALTIHPDFGDALDSRGLIYLKQCRNADALADYNSALRYNPQRASSLFGRGIAKLRTGDRAGGDNDIVKAKGTDPNIAEEFRGYGITAPTEVTPRQ